MGLKIGAQLYTVRRHTQDAGGLQDALARVKTMGYDYVQLSGHSADIEPQIIRDALEQYGLEAPTTHISFDQMQEDFANVVATHKLWGATYPGVGGMPAKFREAGLGGFKQFAKEASEVAKRFKDEGMTFIYHNHNFEFVRFGGTLGYEVLIGESSDDVQFELDTHWVQAGGGDPAYWIRQLRGRMDVIHFKDMQILPADAEHPSVRQTYAEIGHGNLNWDTIFDACRDIGVRYAFVEQDETLMSTPFISLEMSRRFLSSRGYD
jgi:sugar phosphate isomerase/epimerase